MFRSWKRWVAIIIICSFCVIIRCTSCVRAYNSSQGVFSLGSDFGSETRVFATNIYGPELGENKNGDKSRAEQIKFAENRDKYYESGRAEMGNDFLNDERFEIARTRSCYVESEDKGSLKYEEMFKTKQTGKIPPLERNKKKRDMYTLQLFLLGICFLHECIERLL